MSTTARSTPRHALVTGASRGIGAAIVHRLVADGVRVSLLARDAAKLRVFADSIDPTRLVTVINCDVADAQAVAEAMSKVERDGGPVQILVNNAGQAQSAPLSRTSDTLWQDMIAVNLTGTFYCTRAALPAMLASGWGRIINIASTAGQRGYPYVSAYVAAKHGVIGLTRALALEVARQGITVNAVCPGFTDTDLLATSIANIVGKTGRSADDAIAELTRHNPQGRIIQPDEVAETVAWLCTEGAASINGQSLSVSGGEVM